MLKVTAITLGKVTPSSRFRVRQYIPLLKEKNCIVHEYPSIIPYDFKIPFKYRQRYLGPLVLAVETLKVLGTSPAVLASYFSDIVWLNRGMAGGHNLMEKFLKKPIYFDIDDALWVSNPNIYKQAIHAHAVIAGNSYIANWFSRYNKNTYVVPTAIDTTRFVPSAVHKSDKFIIGWTGSSDGLQYLYRIEDQLNIFFKNHKDAVLKIICDRKPEFKLIPTENIVYVPWKPDTENIELQDISIGIMPLPDNEWSRGKCSFKMLQYMSTSIPVIVSNVGMNAEILEKSSVGIGVISDSEWMDALTFLWEDRELGIEMGKKGRDLVVNEYSSEVVSDQLISIFNK